MMIRAFAAVFGKRITSLRLPFLITEAKAWSNICFFI